MAFELAEIARIRQYLGYPGVARSSIFFLEGAISVSGDDENETAIIRLILDSLEGIEEKLQDVQGRLQATQVGKIKLAHMEEIRALRAEGRRYCNQLSIKLNVPLDGDYFGEDGIPGFVQASPYSRAQARGNMIQRG